MHGLDVPTAGSRAFDPGIVDTRLERSVADTLRVIAAVCAERDAPSVKAARRHLAEVHGATRLSRRLERRSASA